MVYLVKYILSRYTPCEVLYSFRQKRGMELATTRTIRRKGNFWIVPSQVGAGFYTVDLRGEQSTCSCPDYKKHYCTCKHIYAAFYIQLRNSK